MNKKKIFNDPVYGLIRFPFDSLYAIIDHAYFQRLRRISQQALSHYVYPGALHTRFQHAMGATFLMTKAIETLRAKDVEISDEEYEAVCIAILLHDVGHGPFSHSLEHVLANVNHESISLIIMEKIGKELGKDFSMVLDIFRGNYRRPFLHQLVSGQIDTDRMDYLTRDSFFSGVAEGIIGYDRILTMMNVADDQLVIEEKGVYSVEKFLMARRLMYWQVYLHKTVISAEMLLISILKRAKYLTKQGIAIPSSDELNYFLKLDINDERILSQPEFLSDYVLLDDMDILWMIKKSVNHPDQIFSSLCNRLLHRQLFKVKSGDTLENQVFFDDKKSQFMARNHLNVQEADYFFTTKTEKIKLYEGGDQEIKILMKDGKVVSYSALHPQADLFSTEERKFWFYSM